MELRGSGKHVKRSPSGICECCEFQVLLVSSMAHPDRWIVPGGKVEPDEDPETSAAREAMEEAGVVGNLGRCLGVFENPERKHRTR